MTEPPPFILKRGQLPLIVSMPHIAPYLPLAIAASMTPHALLVEDTDWHVDKLYAFLDALDVTVIKATHSRYVIDLNRPPDGGLLYPGKTESALCPAETFRGAALYLSGEEPAAEEIDRRRARYWQPYHDALAAEIRRLRSRHARVMVFDAHSIRSAVPRLFDGQLPDLNFGTADGHSARGGLVERLAAAAGTSSFSSIVNGRFKGGYITRHYGEPSLGTDAVQLELGWRAYLDEDRPQAFESRRAASLIDVLKRIILAALE